jgi:hypothetical protein
VGCPHCNKYEPAAGKIGATGVGQLLDQVQGSFILLLSVTERRNLPRKGRSGHLVVCSGGVRKMSVQKVVPKMRKVIMLHVRVSWPVVVLAEKRENLELTEQLALSIILS